MARDQARPNSPLIVEVATSVTPGRHLAGPTVLDECRESNARGSAAGLGGDVGGTDQIPMPMQSAVRTTEPATLRLGHPLMAGWTGGGTATLVHQSYCDSCQFCLVPKRLHKVEVAPLPQAEVLQSTGIPVGYAREVTHHQDPNPVPQGEGDDLLGGLVMGLVDTTAVARLSTADPGPVAAPAPRAALARLRRPPGGSGIACLLIVTVQVALGADRAP